MSKTQHNGHISVLLHELVEHIHIFEKRKNIIIDGTLGLGGHAREIIKKMHPGDIFVGFDADDVNLEFARQNLQDIAKEREITLHLIHSNFVHLKNALENKEIKSITGIYFDLGISSLHIDDGRRGFSIKHDGPLDMRFDRHQGKNAADIINYYSEKELIEIFREYGEENSAPKIARYIIEARKQKKIESTRELADIIEKANSYPGVKERIFQALRIEVNQELKNEEKAIKDGLDLLESDGTIFVISFHSLEDRIVKNIFRDESRDCICSDLICTCKHKRSIEILTKKPIVPSSEEIRENIRSRSAKARAAKKL